MRLLISKSQVRSLHRLLKPAFHGDYAVTLFNPDAGENGVGNVEVLLGPDLSPRRAWKVFYGEVCCLTRKPLRSGVRGKTRYPQELRGSVDLTMIARLAGPSQGQSAARADLQARFLKTNAYEYPSQADRQFYVSKTPLRVRFYRPGSSTELARLATT